MGRIGEIFREKRLSHGLTLEQVADETNISTRYLQGIESDNFRDFPGEVYIQGFIRNYAEFLGLDAEQMIARYRAKDDESVHSAESRIPSPSMPAAAVQAARPSEGERTGGIAEPVTSDQITRPSQLPEQAVTPPLFPEVMQESIPSETISESRSAPSRSKKSSKARGQNPPASKAAESLPSPPEEAAPSPSFSANPPDSKPAASPRRRISIVVLGAIALTVATVLALILVRFSGTARSAAPSRQPVEYRAEGLPFEQRIYPGDRVYLPLDDDFVSVMLDAVSEKTAFSTPYGTFTAGLNEEAVINPSSERERLVLTVKDFAPQAPQHGVLVRFEVKEALTSSSAESGITIPAGSGTPGSPAPTRAADTPQVVFKSASGPHQFFVNVSFASPVMFRYEADRREWVEKYYRKGESITINVSNSVTFWTSNAQSVRINVYQSAGKSTEFSMGGAGEIAVKRLSWSSAQGGWALIATTLD